MRCEAGDSGRDPRVAESQAAVPAGAGDAERPAGASSPATRLRVLVVEDSSLIALDLETILADAGHAVVGPVGTVGDALAVIGSDPPDIALLDLNLDGELATPVADRLQSLGVPFALLTGLGEEGCELSGVCGAAVLAKPFEGPAVVDLVAALAARRATSV